VSTDALLTLAAAVIAILTFLSAEGREDLWLRFTWPLRFVAGFAFLILVAIKLSPVWLAAGMPALVYWRWGFDAEIASFVTIGVASVLVIAGTARFRLKPKAIERFSVLAERLLFAGKYAELLFLLERHFSGLKRTLEGRHWATRLKKSLKPDELHVFIGFLRGRVGNQETHEEWTRRQNRLTTKACRWLADRLPDHEEHARRARRLVERVFQAEAFVDYLSKARPDVALKVLDLKVPFFTDGFLDMLVTAWMKNPNSVLYEETSQNQNTRDGHRYRFEALNPVLWHLFGDPFRAEELRVYKPVGDFVLQELERLRRTPEEDVHRKPRPRFIEEGRWRSPIHLGLRLFDFWISESLYRGSHWHGWLMYWENCVEEIVANMADLDRIDETAEFPTAYHYLLYEIFAAFGNWIEDATTLDENLESVKIDRVDLMPGAIAKSAVVTLAHMLRTVLESRNVNMQFKARALVRVLEWYKEAVKREDLKDVYRLALERGGQRFGAVDPYHDALRRTIPEIDRTRLFAEPGEELLERLEGILGIPGRYQGSK
jgi:hypothetical protein